VRDRDGYHCPRDWHRMSIGWYLNHSDRPNVAMNGMRARATRAIPAGTELTVDYGAL
jgi:hypothetical protein